MKFIICFDLQGAGRVLDPIDRPWHFGPFDSKESCEEFLVQQGQEMVPWIPSPPRFTDYRLPRFRCKNPQEHTGRYWRIEMYPSQTVEEMLQQGYVAPPSEIPPSWFHCPSSPEGVEIYEVDWDE